jgi:hypothetical protein
MTPNADWRAFSATTHYVSMALCYIRGHGEVHNILYCALDPILEITAYSYPL